MSEPLNVQQGDKPLGQTVEELLAEFKGIGADGILHFQDGRTYYPSPGGLQEQIRSVLVQVQPTNVQTRMTNQSGFSTSGQLRAMEACQALRAAQVGGLPECRLERNIYDLLLRRGMNIGPWIGEEIELAQSQVQTVIPFEQLGVGTNRRRFQRVTKELSTHFLEVVCSRFDELDRNGDVVGSRILEYVVPRPLSRNTVAVAPLCLHNGEVLFGVDDDDRPAAQCFCGSSQLLVAPAWRLPRDVVGIRDSRSWISGKMRQEYGAVFTEAWELGGAYFPSPGVTPEVVYPLAVQVDYLEPHAPLQLNWVPLTQLVRNRGRLQDGHLLTLVLRAAHALLSRA